MFSTPRTELELVFDTNVEDDDPKRHPKQNKTLTIGLGMFNHKDLDPCARSSVSLRGGFHVVHVGSIGAHTFMKGYHLLG
jgi:hypothetical protein